MQQGIPLRVGSRRLRAFARDGRVRQRESFPRAVVITPSGQRRRESELDRSCVPRLCIKRNGLTDMLNPLSYRFTSTHFGEIASTLCAILTETDGNACSSHPELHCWFHVPRSPMCIHISQTILLNSPAVWPFRAIPAPTFR